VLAIVSPTIAEAQDPYSAFGLNRDSVSAFFTRIQSAVQRRDTLLLASMIDFPMSVTDAHGYHHIRSRHEFLASYDSVFTPVVREVIAAQRFDELFVNRQGVMIGQGQLWFSGICNAEKCEHSRLRIITVNRDAPLPDWFPRTRHPN
jgi:hypothetical protein